MERPVIKNKKGEVVTLNAQEQRIADLNQLHCNALGYEIDITTLTTIIKEVSEQKFFRIAPADYVPVKVGQGAFSSQLTTYRSFQLGDDFATGIIDTGGNNGRLAMADAGVDSVTVVVKNWAKAIGWTLFDLQQAAKAGNWDLISAKEESRKTNWDLGIQSVAFLGLSGDANVKGLYTQGDVNANTTIIPQSISSLSTVDLKQLCATIVDAYRSNCARTAWPTHFILPESDYLGLGSQASADFPIKSTLQLLREMFAEVTMQPNFKVLPNAYGDDAYSDLGVQKYIMLNYDPKSVRMDIPVDYTNTLANSLDNFAFQNVGYGQFTGVKAYRPLEMLYFTYNV